MNDYLSLPINEFRDYITKERIKDHFPIKLLKLLQYASKNSEQIEKIGCCWDLSGKAILYNSKLMSLFFGVKPNSLCTQFRAYHFELVHWNKRLIPSTIEDKENWKARINNDFKFICSSKIEDLEEMKRIKSHEYIPCLVQKKFLSYPSSNELQKFKTQINLPSPDWNSPPEIEDLTDKTKMEISINGDMDLQTFLEYLQNGVKFDQRTISTIKNLIPEMSVYDRSFIERFTTIYGRGESLLHFLPQITDLNGNLYSCFIPFWKNPDFYINSLDFEKWIAIEDGTDDIAFKIYVSHNGFHKFQNDELLNDDLFNNEIFNNEILNDEIQNDVNFLPFFGPSTICSIYYVVRLKYGNFILFNEKPQTNSLPISNPHPQVMKILESVGLFFSNAMEFSTFPNLS